MMCMVYAAPEIRGGLVVHKDYNLDFKLFL